MAEGLLPGRSPLVGRDDELARMQAALDVVMGGQGRLLLISGEPGIGKTRLVEELAALAVDQGAMVAWGRVDDVDGAPPYWPWTQLLDGVLENGDGQVVSEALEQNAGAIAAILPRVKEFVEEVTPPPLLDPVAARFRLHDAIVDFLGHVGVHRRHVLILDDMHWADVASLELTKYVAARLNHAPLLLVGTYRSVDGGSSESFDDVLASLARQPTLDRIALAGLSEVEVGQFMTQTIGLRSRPAVVATMHARTEGNPFFVAELARLLQSEGLLGAARGPGQAAVPVGVRDVVRRRLSRLPEPTNDLLVLGAVVGREFDLATLAVTAEMGEGDVVDAIEPALSAGVITEAVGVVGRFRFSHALIRDTVYGQHSVVRRATLHARVGTALEQHQQGTAPSNLAELAWHFFHAAPILGPQRGLAYTLQAARAAQDALAYERAEDDLRRALSLIELLPVGSDRSEQELQVQNRLAALLIITKGRGAPELGLVCARAREICRVIGESDDLFSTLFNAALFHVTSCQFQLLAELGAQFLAVGEQRASTVWLLAGQLCVASAQNHTGALAAAEESYAAVESLARSLDPSSPATELFGEHPLALCLPLCAFVAWLRGDKRRADGLCEEAVELARSVDQPFALADTLYGRNKQAVLAGDAARTLSEADEALELCEKHGFGMFHAWLRTHRGWALCHHGRFEEGVGEMTAGMDADRAGGGRLNTVFFLGLLADVEALRGEHEHALALVEEALAVTRAGEQKLYEADLYHRRGELIATRGPQHTGEALNSFRKALSVAEIQGAVVFKHRAEAALAALQKAGDARPTIPERASSGLSPRERELLALVGRGRTDKQIAADLMISLATVRSHMERIRDKTGQRRRAELTRLAVDLGLISR